MTLRQFVPPDISVNKILLLIPERELYPKLAEIDHTGLAELAIESLAQCFRFALAPGEYHHECIDASSPAAEHRAGV